MSKTIKPFRCVVCKERFTEDDATKYTFFRATKVCFACYEAGQKMGHRDWCFGKRDKKNKAGVIIRWGRDPEREECKVECPDRRICAAFLFVRKDGEHYRKIDRLRDKVAK